MKLYLNYINAILPGVAHSWIDFAPLLLDDDVSAFDDIKQVKYKPTILPANESRRASTTVKLAFQVCEPIHQRLSDDELHYQSVFATSGGDYAIFDKICKVLVQDERQVSPTQFHNSVLNAPAGYWGIATQNQNASTTLSGSHYSPALGLVESATRILCNEKPVLLCGYDICPPSPLNQVRDIAKPFAFAMYFSCIASPRVYAELELEIVNEGDPLVKIALPKHLNILERSNPMLRILPLLHLLSKREAGEALIPLGEKQFLRVCVNV